MKTLLMIVSIFAVVGCQAHPESSHGGEHEGEHGHPHPAVDSTERPGLSFTHWTDRSELFIELPALVLGLDSPCAAHVTDLLGFSALGDGRVSVVLRNGAAEERFTIDAPTVPGIFRPIVRPSAAGIRRLIVEVRGEDLSADHDLGDVTVYESAAAARAAIPEEAAAVGRIPFLKEQQWPIEFGTAPAAERVMRSTLWVVGTIIVRTAGDVVISVFVVGCLQVGLDGFPQLGVLVTAGQTLASIAPRLEAEDLASLDVTVASAALDLRFATSERARLEALRAEGVVPDQRVAEATHRQREAQLSLSAARRRLNQFQQAQDKADQGEGTLALTAPIKGVVTEVHRAPSSYVEAGASLFRVTDLADVWLEARVPEGDIGKIQGSVGARFSADGMDTEAELPATAFIARASRVDPKTRTGSLTFGVDNRVLGLTLGAFVRVHIVRGEDRLVLAVPESAIVDDGGFLVVFVQVEGEAFERRPVLLGTRDRGHVEVLSGVALGDHVVTQGAWSVKLAASSGSVPAHGHAH